MRLTTESYRIASTDPGIELYVRNKRPEGSSPHRALLFVHGATYPSDTMFDLKIDGESWMDFVARHGFDVYSLDVRGYGRSTRPPEMDHPALDNPPVVTTDEAVRDFEAVVDHIRQRRGVPRVNLMGWSWGTVIAGAFAAAHPEKTERLVNVCAALAAADSWRTAGERSDGCLPCCDIRGGEAAMAERCSCRGRP